MKTAENIFLKETWTPVLFQQSFSALSEAGAVESDK